MKKVMIAEDDLLIADLLEDALLAAGFEVCGQASTVAGAVDLCRQHQPDLAVIDLRLADGGMGTDIAALLSNSRSPGILYATGNASHVVLTAQDGDAVITKPYQDCDIVRALEIVAELVNTGRASKPFPRNFQLLKSAGSQRAPGSISHGP